MLEVEKSAIELLATASFGGIRVDPYSSEGAHANSSPGAFAEALSPYLVDFQNRYRIEPIDEHRARYRAMPTSIEQRE